MKLYRMPLHTPFANLSEQNLIRLSSEDLPYAIIENKQDMRFIYPPCVRHAPAMELLVACGSSHGKIFDYVQQGPQVNESPAGVASRNLSALLFSHEGRKTAILEELGTPLDAYFPEEQVKWWPRLEAGKDRSSWPI